MSKALKAAIEANDPEAVRQVLKTVKDVNRKLPGAMPPLLYACARGADKVLEPLLQAGAVAEKRHTFPGDTPFAVAAQHRQKKVLKELWELNQASESAVQHAIDNAAMDGDVQALDMVLRLVNPPITTALFNIASHSKSAVEMVRLLVERGGCIDVRDGNGLTLLHGAARGGRIEVMRAAVACGADVNARDRKGLTPLIHLAEQLEWLDRDDSAGEALKALEALLHLGQMPT
jgi:ankyrin repeat protein